MPVAADTEAAQATPTAASIFGGTVRGSSLQGYGGYSVAARHVA